MAIATRDTAEAQRLLNLSLDISAATGKDLGSVTAALSKAYLGNNTALTRLGVGISKADLKTKSFYEITTNLADTFKGSATAAAATFRGSMDKLAVASVNVQEIIGTGIIDALTKLGNDDSVSNLAKNMEAAALYTADVIRGIGVLTEKLKSLPGVSNFKVGMIPILGAYLEGLSGLGKQSRTTPKPFSTPMTVSGQTSNKTALVTQNKLQKDTLKATKDSLKLAKAKAVFDLQKIQIEAALKGKISAEDEIRLKLMKAIVDENMTDVEKYQKALETAQTKTKELTELLATVKTLEIKDPFGTWSVDPLTAAINALTTSIGGVGTQIQASGREWSSFANTVATTVIRPNLSEWSSSFSSAAAAASAAVGSANAALASSTAASSSAASAAAKASTEAIAAANKATADAIAAANKTTADAIAAAEKAQSEILAKLKADSAATTAAIKADQEKAVADAQAAADALDKQIEATLAAIRAKAAQDAEAAAAAAATVTGTGGSNVSITVNTGVGDPNAIAEEIQKILDDAHSRGSLVGGLYAG